jgi:NTE family protein
VLEGGGIRGVALVGAVNELQDRGYTIRRVAGSSVGALVGAFVAAGTGPDELRQLLLDLPFAEFPHKTLLARFGRVGMAASILATQGVYRGDVLHRWVREHLPPGARRFDQLIDPDPSPHQPADRRHRLVITASDLTTGELCHLPWHLTEHFTEVADAVRASTAIPFVFQPYKTEADAAGQRHWLVDGGLLSNFPVDIFDTPPSEEPRFPTFGIRLGLPSIHRNEVRNTLSMAKSIVDTVTGFYDRSHLDQLTQQRSIFIDVGNVQVADFNLDQKGKEQLYDNGRRAVAEFCDQRWDWEGHLQLRRQLAGDQHAGETGPAPERPSHHI